MKDLHQQTNMHNAKEMSTPMATFEKLQDYDGNPSTDHTSYRYTIRSMKYLSLTRSNIYQQSTNYHNLRINPL